MKLNKTALRITILVCAVMLIMLFFVACQPAPGAYVGNVQTVGNILEVSRIGDLTRTIDAQFGTVCYENYAKTAIYCIKH